MKKILYMMSLLLVLSSCGQAIETPEIQQSETIVNTGGIESQLAPSLTDNSTSVQS
jgi:hypothetical protein